MGYGGTRYFPLHIVLHAGLIKLGATPLFAGRLLTLLATVALLLGVLALQRQLDVAWGWAALFCCALLASESFELGTYRVAGDLLGAALNVGGIAAFARARRTGRGLFWPTLLFVLAFAAKQTAVFGLVACVLTLWLSAETRRLGWRLALYCALGCAGALVGTQWLSGGRFWESLRACGTGGQIHLRDFFGAAVSFLRFSDDSFFGFKLLAFGAWFLRPRRSRAELPELVLLSTAALTLLVLVSPGTAMNHVIDLDVAAIVFVSTQVARQRIPMALGAAVIGLATMVSLTNDLVAPQSDPLPQALADIRRGGPGPTLAENPWWPILNGERPYLLDAWSFRVVSQKRPEIMADLLEKMDQHFFRSIILEHVLDLHAYRADGRWYGTSHFGPGFVESLQRNYELVSRHRGFFLWLPKEPKKER
jgi:hypothetical protein